MAEVGESSRKLLTFIYSLSSRWENKLLQVQMKLLRGCFCLLVVLYQDLALLTSWLLGASNPLSNNLVVNWYI